MRSKHQSSIPLYIRFGEIPENENSAVHRSDDLVRNEGGVSVWRAIEDQGKYWPLLPDDPNANTIADYFSMLLNLYGSNKKVYLVTGWEICIEGADREPLIRDVKIIKDISSYYNRSEFNLQTKHILDDLLRHKLITEKNVSKYLSILRSENPGDEEDSAQDVTD